MVLVTIGKQVWDLEIRTLHATSPDLVRRLSKRYTMTWFAPWVQIPYQVQISHQMQISVWNQFFT